MLDSLYPLSKHSPDRCLICGCTYSQHLASWWFQNLYTPYDLHLDRIYRDATKSSPGMKEETHVKKSQRYKQRKQRETQPITNKYEPTDLKPFLNGTSGQGSNIKNFIPFNFHKPYVNLVGEETEETQMKLRDSRRRHKKQLHDEDVILETRSSIFGIQYQVARKKQKKSTDASTMITQQDNSNQMTRSKFISLAFSKAIVLQQLENLLYIESKENLKRERRLIRGF